MTSRRRQTAPGTINAALVCTLLLLLAGCSRSSSPPPPQQPSLAAPPNPGRALLDPALSQRIETNRLAVIAAPQSADAWGALGQSFEAAEFLDEAQLCYKRASELDPASVRWRYLLALRQLQNDPGSALSNLRGVAAILPPTNDAPRLRLAQALVERGHFEEARTNLNILLAQNPAHAAARLELARVEFASGELAPASALLQPCLTNPHTARPALLLLSQVQQRAGDSNSAAALARRAASLPRPYDWPDPYLREVQSLLTDQKNVADRANALMMQRRIPEAEDLLSESLARDPQNAEVLLLLGRLRIQQRRCDEAAELLQRHLAIRTNSLQGCVQLGLAHYCASRWAAAADAFQTAVNLKPDFAQAHYNLGLALARDHRSAAAIEAFRTALRCQPGDPAAHAALAEEHLRLGQRDQARSEAENALQLDPRNAKAQRVRDALKL